MHRILVLSAVLLVIYSSPFSKGSTSNSKSSNLSRPLGPEVTLLVDRIRRGYDFFEYVKPVRNANQVIQIPAQFILISKGQSISVEKSKIFFWYKSNLSVNESATATTTLIPVDIKLKLTCGAEYFTKWQFNSDHNVVIPAEVSDVEYDLEFKNRGEENLLHAVASDQEPFSKYTELLKLTIRSFQPHFKSLTIDCVSYHNESIKTRVHIFQRFKTFRDTQKEDDYLNLTQGAVVPCKVHDPGVKVRLRRKDINGVIRNVTNRFRFDWTKGFVSLRTGLQYHDGDEYSCILNNGKSVTYKYNATAQFPDLKTTQVVIRLSKTSPLSIWTFTCSLSDDQKSSNHTMRLHSLQVEACDSPDYCHLNREEDADVRTKMCSSQENETCDFPKLSPEQGRQSKLHDQGKITCFVEIDHMFYSSHNYYFLGLSKEREFYLLSSSFEQKEILKIKLWRSAFYPYTTWFNCTALKFLTYNFPSMKLSIKSHTSSQEINTHGQFFNEDNEYGFNDVEISFTRDVFAVNCHVPMYNSSQWMTTTYTYKEDEKSYECQYSEFGCCPDERTPASGPSQESCGCESSRFGCCLDGTTEASGKDFEGCKEVPIKPGDVCGLDKEKGPCRNFTFKWFFDIEYGGCSRFWYGGCYGNNNRFETQDECKAVCVEPVGRDACYLPRVAGPCEGYYPSWYYDPQRGRCEQFLYGGCLGNNNRYTSREQCENTCLLPDRVDACDQPKTKGPCRGNVSRIYFDKDSESCQAFQYSGCKGNNNNFLTEKECHQRCKKEGRVRALTTTPTTTTTTTTPLRPITTTISTTTSYARTTATSPPQEEIITTLKPTEPSEDDLTSYNPTSTSTTASTPERKIPTDEYNVEPNAQSGDSRIIVLGVALAVILITVLVIGFTVHQKQVRNLQEKLRELTDEEIQAFFEGSQGAADPASAGYGFIESQPFNKDNEIPSDQLQIHHDNKLGSGAFGLVLKGTLKGSNEPGSRTAVDISVAVKTVKPNVEVSIFVALLTEMKVMCFVGDHPHIVALHGAQTTKIRTREVYIALEFCVNGDLINFLKTNRANFNDMIGETKETVPSQRPVEPVTSVFYAKQMNSITISQPPSVDSDIPANQSSVMSTLHLIKWAQEISSGMEFLGSKNVIHGDLAARNVLLTADKTAKVSDFGLSRQLHNYSTYKKKTKTPLPWKWMAIESLSDMEFSVQSDVWSFGVTLFEIFSLGTIPYPGRTWTNEFVDELVAGLRLNTPKFGNDEIRNLMMDCMKLEPLDRLKFQEMGHRFTEIKRKLELQLNPDSLSNYIVT